jgi:phosphatidylinositol alpha-1,6-mannosyltransferase
MYAGALFPHSGLATVLEALPRIREALPAARLMIVGTGPDEDRLRGLVAKRGLSGAVEFRGPRPYGDLPRMLADADVGLAIAERSAFRRYACPLKLLEYAAAGVPALATAGTEAGDMVRRHHCGLAVPQTPTALADALLSLLTDAGLHADLRRGALAFAAEHTWNRLLAREAELIRATRHAPVPAPRVPVASAEVRV